MITVLKTHSRYILLYLTKTGLTGCVKILGAYLHYEAIQVSMMAD